MQAEVLPVPIAPTTATPVNSPFSPIMSQPGRSDSTGSVRWWVSPTTSESPRSRPESGQEGSEPRPPLALGAEENQICQAETRTAPPTPAAAQGAR